MIDTRYLEEARRSIDSVPNGEKTLKSKQWANLFGVTLQTLHRWLNPQPTRERKGEAMRPEYHSWATVVFQIKNRPPEEAGVISTVDAVALAIKAGLIPASASDVPVATFDSIARKKGWHKRETRANRFQAERPNQGHHFDASTSKYLYIARRVGNDYALRLHRPAKHYKNKPIPVDQLRPWIYGVTDDHSGLFIARYTAARGESPEDSSDFLHWAWSQIGLPNKLLCDQGMLKKALHTRDLIDRLKIEMPEMMPYQKRGHGKIERPWRTWWQKAEKPLFAANEDWKKFEIGMSELNIYAANYLAAYNQMPHRFEREITRQQAWNRVNLHGGIVQIPEDALKTVARREERTIGPDGILKLDGRMWESKHLHSAKVLVYFGVFKGQKDRIIIQDIETGIKYDDLRPFKALGLDEFRAHPETPHQKLIKESAGLLTGKETMLYAEKKTPPEKVISMPIRTKEEREIADPFDVEHYADINEAMREFHSTLGAVRLTQSEREEVKTAIIRSGLRKAFVTDLALELRASIERQRQTLAS